MARLTLSKSALSRETKQLQTFERFRPSLEMKRRQLLTERAGARAALNTTRAAVERLRAQVTETLPMLANQRVDLHDLVRVTAVDLNEENLVGVRLPVLGGVSVEVKPYGLLAKPHWVDRLVGFLRLMLELQVRLQVETQRLALLDRAVQIITQRVNLFDKVLIPRARANIQRIRIYLADADRAAVVRAKLAKARMKRRGEV